MSILLDRPETIPADVLPGPHPASAESPEAFRESAAERIVYALLAAALVAGFFLANARYWVPVHPGVDQNGYLVGGKMLAENLTMKLAPVRPGSGEFDPHQFIGRMWVGADFGTPAERYYPKYPIGYPALIAVALWMGGGNWGPILAYWINPVAMALGVAGTYLLVRAVVRSSFMAFCAAAVLAASPVIMGLATNPNSHATAVCCVTWGMYFLVRWWQAGGLRRAIPAGLLLGYAATIRYTEATLLLPLVLVVLMAFRWRQRRSWIESLWAVGAWAIPVGLLVAYNLAAMGRVTGYDGTNESTGFSPAYAADNWETSLRQLGSIALFAIFPFSVLGLVALFWRNWRMGIVLAAWVLPCLLIYVLYYWAPDPVVSQPAPSIGYMRFYATVLPGLVLAAYWVMHQYHRHLARVPPDGARAGRPGYEAHLAQLCIGIITWIALAVGLQTSTFNAEFDHLNRLMLQVNSSEVLATAPAGSVLVSPQTQFLHHLQFVRDYVLYTGDTFNKSFIDRLPLVDPDEPQGWEPGWRDSLYSRFKDLTQQQLDEQERSLIADALDSGRRVFFIVQRRDNDLPVRRRWNAEARGPIPGAELLRRLLAAPARFDVEVVDAWFQPNVRPPVQGSPFKPRGRRVEWRGDRRAASWQIVEVTRKPPPPPAPPSTRPSRRK